MSALLRVDNLRVAFAVPGGTIEAVKGASFRLRPGSTLAVVGESGSGKSVIAQGKANLQAPWLGITAFLALTVMLSLLVFAGEAVRDAFDPRKTVG